MNNYIVIFLGIVWVITLNIALVKLWYNKDFFSGRRFLLNNLFYIALVNSKFNNFFTSFFLKEKEKELIIKTLNFFYNSKDFLTLFIGISSILIALYIHALGIKNKFDKRILKSLMEENKFLEFFIGMLLFLTLGGMQIYLLAGFLYLFYLLFDAIRWIRVLENMETFRKNYDRAKKRIFKKKEGKDEFLEAYIELKEVINEAVRRNNISDVKNYVKIYKESFMKDGIKLENIQGTEAYFISQLYDVCLKSKEDDIFRNIDYLHINLANEYLEVNELKGFEDSLILMEKIYEYHYNHPTDNFEHSVVSGMRYNIPEEIWNKYSTNKEEAIRWYSAYFNSITNCVKKAIENKDYTYAEELILLISQPFRIKVDYNNQLTDEQKKLFKEYCLLESSAYFGVVLYLEDLNEALKSSIIKNFIDKIKREEISNYSLDLNLIGCDYLIELYDFIKKYKIDKLSKWEDIYMPKLKIVGVTVWNGESQKKIDELFLELLAFSNINEKIYEYSNSKYKLNNRVHLLIKLLKEKEFEVNMDGVLGFLNKLNEELQKEKDKKVRESKVDNSKIKFIKNKVENFLNESNLINLLNKEIHYRVSDEVRDDLKEYGMWKFYPKSEFIEEGSEGYLKAFSKSLAEAQNRAVEKLFMRGLKGAEEKGLSEALKEKEMIIVSRGAMFKFRRRFRREFKESIYLDKNIIENFCGLLFGIYEYEGREVPVLNLDSEEKGVWVLNLDDIDKFYHYKIWNKGEENKLGYAYFSIKDVKELLEDEKEKEKLLSSKWLEGLESKGEKIKELEKKVWLAFYQKGELKLKKGAKIYKISEKDLLKKES